MGMMFPKQPTKKKRKKHKPSILQKKDGRCYLCMKEGNYRIHPVVHEHHVYFGTGNRKISEEEGFKVFLCPEHHTLGSEAVHNNPKNAEILYKDCQRAYEKNHTRQQFYDLIGKYYLEEDE